MIDIAILTPHPAEADEEASWRKVLARLQSALAEEGMATTPVPWTAHAEDPAPLLRHACVLPLLAWGYHKQQARWLRACEAWRQAGVAMANPAGVLAWNSDKRYLATLADRGVAVPATQWTSMPTRERLERAFAETGAEALIVKPSVSGGAWKTLRVHRDDPLDAVIADAAPGIEMLIQPYLPTIASEGETSLLFFGGRLSHAVNKRPVAGDFRVQEQFGGQYRVLAAPPAGALALAEQTLAAVGQPLLYARIDMVPDADGRWLLMEAELIEPDFYLGADPRRGAGFAQALRAWLADGCVGASA